eukprot:2176992-Amphidinium_carterae.1
MSFSDKTLDQKLIECFSSFCGNQCSEPQLGSTGVVGSSPASSQFHWVRGKQSCHCDPGPGAEESHCQFFLVHAHWVHEEISTWFRVAALEIGTSTDRHTTP